MIPPITLTTSEYPGSYGIGKRTIMTTSPTLSTSTQNPKVNDQSGIVGQSRKRVKKFVLEKGGEPLVLGNQVLEVLGICNKTEMLAKYPGLKFGSLTDQEILMMSVNGMAEDLKAKEKKWTISFSQFTDILQGKCLSQAMAQSDTLQEILIEEPVPFVDCNNQESEVIHEPNLVSTVDDQISDLEQRVQSTNDESLDFLMEEVPNAPTVKDYEPNDVISIANTVTYSDGSLINDFPSDIDNDYWTEFCDLSDQEMFPPSLYVQENITNTAKAISNKIPRSDNGIIQPSENVEENVTYKAQTFSNKTPQSNHGSDSGVFPLLESVKEKFTYTAKKFPDEIFPPTENAQEYVTSTGKPFTDDSFSLSENVKEDVKYTFQILSNKTTHKRRPKESKQSRMSKLPSFFRDNLCHSLEFGTEESLAERETLLLNSFNTSEVGMFTCKVCQKNSMHRSHILEHVWANHYPIKLTCKYCTTKWISKTIKALKVHVNLVHFNMINDY